jgi:hypothetical protein
MVLRTNVLEDEDHGADFSFGLFIVPENRIMLGTVGYNETLQRAVSVRSIVFAFALMVASALVSALPAVASTILVPEQYPTIEDALAVADQGDTVFVGPGTWSSGSGVYQMVDGVTLMSTDGPESTRIDAMISVQETMFETVIDGFSFIGDFTQIFCNGGSPIIRYNMFEVDSACASHAIITGVKCRSGASPWIEANTFRGRCFSSGSSAYGVFSFDSSPVVLGNTFSERESSVEFSGESSAGRAIDNTFVDCIDAITCSGSPSDTLRGNEIAGCDVAIRLSENCAPAVISNSITDCGTALRLATGADPFIRLNLLEGNSRNVLMRNYSAALAIVAEENWWGSVVQSEIQASIEIQLTAPGCSVDFDPWCLDPNCYSAPVIPSSWGSIKAMYKE